MDWIFLLQTGCVGVGVLLRGGARCRVSELARSSSGPEVHLAFGRHQPHAGLVNAFIRVTLRLEEYQQSFTASVVCPGSFRTC